MRTIRLRSGSRQATNFRGKTTVLEYYAGGNGASLLKKATRPAIDQGGTPVAPVYLFTYDAKGKVVDATNPSGIVTHSDYQTNEDPKDTGVDPGTGSHLNLTTAYTYDIDANLQFTTDPRGYVTESLYDPDRRRTEDHHHDGNGFAPLNAASKTVYDEIGRVIDDQVGTAFSGTNVTTWLTIKHTTYTATSKVATVTDADNRVTATTYDNGDRTRRVTDPLGRKTLFTYCAATDTDCAANQIKVEYRAWQQTTACAVAGTNQQCYRRVTYWPDGEEKTLKDANGNTTSYAYDGFNRLYQASFPDGTNETIPLVGGYDEHGNVLQHTNRAGTTLTYTYDDLDQTRTKSMPQPPAGSLVTTWTYLLDGRIDLLSDANTNSMDYGYDTAGRMTSVVNHISGFGGNRTVGYLLDANGNRTKLTWPTQDVSNYSIGYCYDSLDRMTKALENDTNCASTTALATYAYDVQSRRTNLTYAPTSGGSGAQINYTSYSDAGDLLTQAHDLSGLSNDNTFNWLYTDAHEARSFDANKANWLWRPASNNSTTYTVNNLNQYPTVGARRPAAPTARGWRRGCPTTATAISPSTGPTPSPTTPRTGC